MILNPQPLKRCAVPGVMQSCLLYVTLMPSGLLHRMCDDCGATRAYPVEQRILRRVVTKTRL